MNISIAKGLKEKNRISGKISKLQKQVEQFNRFESGKDPDFNSLDLLKELQTEWAHLIDLNIKIAKANNGIADKLIQLTEAKAELTFWNSFHSAGQASETFDKNSYVDGKVVTVKGIMYSSITSKEVTQHQQRVQKLIEDLQDSIDDYNAKTQI
jgi:hypothetical protein